MSLILRGIDFGPVQGASGIQGFFSGWEYPYRWVLTPLLYFFGYRFNGMTFVSKTSTLYQRDGNAKVRKNGITFHNFKPDCIKAYLLRGIALNSVGLTGPGLLALLQHRKWSWRTQPFMISVMSVAISARDRLFEHKQIIHLLQQENFADSFSTSYALQLNVSCPNTGHATDEFWDEIIPVLDAYETLNVPIVVKINVLMPIDAACKIADHPACDAIVQGNTLPYGSLPDRVNWHKLFGDQSPIEKTNETYGKGGLSGKPLFPLILDWIDRAEEAGISVPIIACGGIDSRAKVQELAKRTSVKACAIGSVSFLRPWRVAGLIREAHKCFSV